jgi:hypothetical protein
MEPTYTPGGNILWPKRSMPDAIQRHRSTGSLQNGKDPLRFEGILDEGVEEERGTTRPRSDDRNKCCAMRPAGAALRFYKRWSGARAEP